MKKGKDEKIKNKIRTAGSELKIIFRLFILMLFIPVIPLAFFNCKEENNNDKKKRGNIMETTEKRETKERTETKSAQNHNDRHNDIIEKPIYDYIEGWYDKDPDRMKEGIHPLLAKRHPDDNVRGKLKSIDLDYLLSVVKPYGGTSGNKRRIDIKTVETTKEIGAAVLLSNDFIDYLHLIKINGEWKIINVLWIYHGSDPSSEDRLKSLTAIEKEALKKPMRDYVEGWYNKSPEQTGSGIHPMLAKRSLNPEKPEQIDEFTRDSLLEVVPLYGGAPEGRKELFVEILDVRENIALTKVVSNDYIDYMHLVKTEEEWKIVNVVWTFR